jgi:hypothetical protein
MNALHGALLVLALAVAGAFSCLAATPSPPKAADCFTATITAPVPFMGNNGEIFQLSDGSFWQVGVEYDFLFAFFPSVIICPSIGKLSVNGRALNSALSDSSIVLLRLGLPGG